MYRNWIVKLTSRARFSTICLHAGQEPDPSTGAIITPIYQTSTYVQEALGKHKGFEYGRTQNPTRMALERNLAAIEGGKAGVRLRLRHGGDRRHRHDAASPAITSSSPTTPTAAPSACSTRCCTRYDLTFTYVDTSKLDDVERAITPATRMLFVETPTNPVMRLTDLRGRGRPRPSPRRRGSSSTTPSPAPTFSGRSSSAPIW